MVVFRVQSCKIELLDNWKSRLRGKDEVPCKCEK